MEKDRVAGMAAAPGRLGVDLAVENPGVDRWDFRERLGIPACKLLGAVGRGWCGIKVNGFRSHQHLFGVLVSLQLFECGGYMAQ